MLSLVKVNLNNAQEIEETYYWQGLVLQAQGKPEQAASSFRRALAYNPNYDEARAALANTQLGNCMASFPVQHIQASGILQRNRRIARSTLTVMIAFAAAKLISLLQTLIIAQAFGVGSELDAYVAANRIPELIVVLISGGALTHAFIPVFSGYLAQGKVDAAWQLSSNLINTIFTLCVDLERSRLFHGAMVCEPGSRARL